HVGQEHHVRLVDRLEPTDRGTVEREPLLDHVLIEGRCGDREVLLGPRHVGEPDVDVLDVLVLDELDDFARGGECHGDAPRLIGATGDAVSSRRAVTSRYGRGVARQSSECFAGVTRRTGWLPSQRVKHRRRDTWIAEVGTGGAPATLGHMRDVAGSWLSGPASSGSGPEQRYKGERLGMPRDGEGSMAALGTRIAALVVDWAFAYAFVGIIVAFGGPAALGGETFAAVTSWAVPVAWAVAGVVCVWLFAQTPGQALLGIGTARVDADERVGFVRS